jgi:hypothetical protein
LRITPLNRPVENHDWMNDPITPERLAASEARQKQRTALHQQFESEWVPPPGYSAERDDEEMENIESAAFSVWKEQRKGRTAAATTPVWVGHLELWLAYGEGMDSSGLLALEPTAVSLTLPFVLKGGGDFQMTFETEKYIDAKLDKDLGQEVRTRTNIKSKHRLVVRTEHGVFTGTLERKIGERGWYLVSLPSNTSQEVADRVARTLSAIDQLNLPDDYTTVMPVSDRCSFCSRPLTDIVSKTLGIGPDCAAKWKIPHSAAVADVIIVKRHAFLAEEVTS